MTKKTAFKKSAVAIALAGIMAGCAGLNTADSSPVEKNLVIGLGLQVNYDSCNSRVLLEQRVQRAYSVGSQLDNVLYVFTGKANPTSLKTCDVDATGKTEAGAMKEILMAKYGVSSDDILLEEQSTSTVENAEFLHGILKEKEQAGEFVVGDMYLVTSAYHNHRVNYKEQRSISSISSFNDVFGDDVFEGGRNVFSSSELGREDIWSSDANLMGGKTNTVNTSRAMGDLNGNGYSDVVLVDHSTGSVEVYLSSGEHFAKAGTTDLVFDADSNVTLADVNGNGFADLVGTSEEGLIVAFADGNGSFGQSTLVSRQFAASDNLHFADITGDQQSEIVKFAGNGTYTARFNGSQYDGLVKVTDDFGSQNYTDENSAEFTFGNNGSDYPRFVADVTGNGLADIVAFGHNSIYVATNDGEGSFNPRRPWLSNDKEGNSANFVKGREFANLNGENQWDTAWSSERHPRGVADINGNGRADIWAIGEHGVYVAWSADMTGNGQAEHFENLNSVWIYETKVRYNQEQDDSFHQFTPWRGWESTAEMPRTFTDVNGNGRADLVGFGLDGVYVAVSENP